MALAPKLYPAGLADRNSNSAYEKLKFIEEHYEELMEAYQVIMEHLKIVNESNQVELPDDLVTYDSDNNVLKSGENTIQISADVPENIVTCTNVDNNNNWVCIEGVDPNNNGALAYVHSNTVAYNPSDNVLFTNNSGTILDLSNLVTSSDLPDTSSFLTSSDLPDTSSFLTSSDLPDLSGYVETSDVANEAGKIPRYNSQGHLVLPDGTEIWCESNE